MEGRSQRNNFPAPHYSHRPPLSTQLQRKPIKIVRGRRRGWTANTKRNCQESMLGIGIPVKSDFITCSCPTTLNSSSAPSWEDLIKSFGRWPSTLEQEHPTNAEATTKKCRKNTAAMRTSWRCTKKILGRCFRGKLPAKPWVRHPRRCHNRSPATVSMPINLATAARCSYLSPQRTSWRHPSQ